MSYTFLGLVNAVLRRFNEVELTLENWGEGIGFYAQVKDSVNAALRDIYATHNEWPFNNVSQNLTLVPNQTRYALPANCQTPDMESFRLRQSQSLGSDGRKLRHLSYDDYLEVYSDQEDVAENDKVGPPHSVFRTNDGKIGFVPRPDKAYAISYEYYRQPLDLVAALDVPGVPEGYRYVITDGACYHAAMFRDNPEQAGIFQSKFQDGLKHMRKALINRNEYVRAGWRIAPVW